MESSWSTHCIVEKDFELLDIAASTPKCWDCCMYHNVWHIRFNVLNSLKDEKRTLKFIEKEMFDILCVCMFFSVYILHHV